MNKTILIATKNPNKEREYREMLTPLGFKVKTLLDFDNLPDIKETGQTFEENALIKAETLVKVTQLPVLADDSGLMVKSLNGEPGVYSARYAGDHDDDANNKKLLTKLADHDDRSAVFTTCLVLLRPDQSKIVVNGNLHGTILKAPRGHNGFGYDPLFFIQDKGQSLAEMSDEEKNSISHRGCAMRQMMAKIKGAVT